MSEPELLSILVPAYNEVSTIGHVVRRLLEVALPISREIPVLDDRSTDATSSADGLPRCPGSSIVQLGPTEERERGPRRARPGARKLSRFKMPIGLDPAQIASLVEPILAGAHGRYTFPADSSSSGPWLTLAAKRFHGRDEFCMAQLTDMEPVIRSGAWTWRRAAPGVERLRYRTGNHGQALRGTPYSRAACALEPRTKARGKKIGWRWSRALMALVRYRFRS